VLITEVHPDDLTHYQVNRDKPHGASSRVAHFSVLKLDQPPFNVKNVQLAFEIDPPYFASYAIYGKSFKLRTFHMSNS
jgi:hypothetical protein